MKRLLKLNIVKDAESELLKQLLDQENIPYTVRNEQLATALGDIPFIECYPELWILDDEDFPRAQQLLDSWQSPLRAQRRPWTCSVCGEEDLEGQFTACWKCGSPRPASFGL